MLLPLPTINLMSRGVPTASVIRTVLEPLASAVTVRTGPANDALTTPGLVLAAE